MQTYTYRTYAREHTHLIHELIYLPMHVYTHMIMKHGHAHYELTHTEKYLFSTLMICAKR